MKIALAAMPRPVLAEPCVLAQSASGHWHELDPLLDEIGHAGPPRDGGLSSALAALGKLGAAGRRKLERALAGRQNGIASPALLKPIDPLAKILLTEGRVALSRSNDQLPAKMVVGFSKFQTALADPGAQIRLPDPQAQYDIEAVLAVVLGKPAARVSARDAAGAVIGFTLMAEVTDRTMFEREWRTSNSLFAKNRLGLSPLGPCILIAGLGELDPAADIALAVNGIERQRFAAADFAHGIAQATKAWSRAVLEPGDMVALGAAIARPRPGNEVDSPIPIAAGDRIEVACAPIGVLSAQFVA
ncbi:MAG TPA: fumarylacetoacetate hydrolase family protein [Stellaceae bacterium]|nr:fumarylacetoacetate hydrolase family protein [Stellaceae bacterium]